MNESQSACCTHIACGCYLLILCLLFLGFWGVVAQTSVLLPAPKTGWWWHRGALGERIWCSLNSSHPLTYQFKICVVDIRHTSFKSTSFIYLYHNLQVHLMLATSLNNTTRVLLSHSKLPIKRSLNDFSLNYSASGSALFITVSL